MDCALCCSRSTISASSGNVEIDGQIQLGQSDSCNIFLTDSFRRDRLGLVVMLYGGKPNLDSNEFVAVLLALIKCSFRL
jgi:hypothetical protein